MKLGKSKPESSCVVRRVARAGMTVLKCDKHGELGEYDPDNYDDAKKFNDAVNAAAKFHKDVN